MVKVLTMLAVSIFCHLPLVAETYTVFEENGKVGLKDDQGQVLIPASYEGLGWSDGPFTVVNNVTGYKQNGLWGLISLQNKQITEPAYIKLTPAGAEWITAYKKPVAKTHVVAGCLNTEGKEVIPFEYEGIKVNSLRAIVFASTGGTYKYGLVDMDNKPVIPMEYQHIELLGSLRYAVTDATQQQALFSEGGKQLTSFMFDDIRSFKKQYAVIKQGARYGVIDREGMLQVRPLYKAIRQEEDGALYGKEPDVWVVLDGQNKIFEKVEADSIVSLNNNLFSLRKNGASQLVNAQFSPVVPDRFDFIGTFINNKAVIRKEGKYGLLSSNGTVLIDCMYADIQQERDYVLACTKPGHWVVLDSMGARKTPRAYEHISRFNGHYFAVKSKAFYGAVNTEGREVISCVYDSLMQYMEGKLVVKFHDAYGIIDMHEEWLVAPQPYLLTLVASDRYLMRKGGTTFLKSFDGTIIYFTENALAIKDGFMIETVSNGGTWKVDFDGRIVSRQLPPVDPYELIYEESEGLRGIKKNGRFGFVDDQGRLRIANRYEDIMPFQERLAAVMILGKWGFINHDERIVIQPVYEETSRFTDGLAVVQQRDLYGLVNKEGDVVLPIRYGAVTRLSTKRFLLEHEGKVGLVDSDGRLVVSPKYDFIQDINNGYVIVARNHQFGLLTIKGLSTVPMMYNFILYDSFNARYFAQEKSDWKKIL